MRTTLACLASFTVMLGVVCTGVASADTTLGLANPPSGSTAGMCSVAPQPTVVQSAQDPTTPYAAPGAGVITQWQINTTGDTPGAPITFAMVRPTAGGNYTVVGADNETIPSPLPVAGVATYTLSSPILVAAGDRPALYSASTGVNCFFFGGSTPAGENIVAVTDPAPPPSAGQTLSSPVPCGSGCTLDVTATLAPATQDAGVSTSAGPPNATAGLPALLSSTVTNHGPGSGPITFTDALPSGLTINAAAAGSGTCVTAGQTVTCTIAGLGVGQSAPVDIVATPASAGSYANSASVSIPSPRSDTNAANNTASTTLTVQPQPPKCVVPKLKGLRLSFAKRLVQLLGCTPGKVRHEHSRSVPKGLVIRTNPGAGTYQTGQKIAFVVSSGPKKEKRHKQKG